MAVFQRTLLHTMILSGLFLQGCGDGYPGGDTNRPEEDPDSDNPPGALTYSVGGNIENLEGTVTLKNRDESLEVSTSGDFTFVEKVAENRNYRTSVSVQPEGGLCYVEGATTSEEGEVAKAGLVEQEAISDIQVNCFRQDVIFRASVSNDEAQANDSSTQASLSYDGSVAVFASSSSSFGNVTGFQQIILRNQRDGSTALVGVAGNGDSREPEMSYNGEYVVFTSEASNLVSGDSNGVSDVFLYTKADDSLRCLSCTTESGVSEGASYNASISRDGQKIAFVSEAENYLDSDDNGVADVFVYDLAESTITRVSLTDAEEQADGASYGADISADGNHLVFISDAANLYDGDSADTPDLFLRDLADESTAHLSTGHTGDLKYSNPSISADGAVVGYVLELNPEADSSCELDSDFARQGTVTTCEAHVLIGGNNDRASYAAAGGSSDGSAFNARISDSGKWLVYSSNATDIVSDDGNAKVDAFIYDVTEKTNARVSVKDGGGEANGHSHRPAISGDDRFVSFESDSTDIVADITNGKTDAFVAPSGK